MRKTKERAGRRWGLLVPLGLGAAALLAAGGFVRELARSRQIDREIRSLKAEADGLRVRNFQISSLEASLRNGEFLEREARVKLGLQKEGEQVVVLRKESPTPAAGTPDPEEDAPPEWSNPKKWWIAFADPKSFEDYVDSRRSATR